jgi:hypothetical protein
MDPSVVTMMHAVRGYFRFAHIDGLIPSDPAVYARLPKVHRDASRTQGLDRLELIRLRPHHNWRGVPMPTGQPNTSLPSREGTMNAR